MEINVKAQLAEIKVQLKKWEIDFQKENGHKATKYDITSNKEVENLYVKYSRLKKDLLSMRSSKACANSKLPTKSNVWGRNLLKATSQMRDESKQLSDSNLSVTEQPQTESSYREKIKNNIGFKCIKMHPVSLRKEKLKSSITENRFPQCATCDSDEAVHNDTSSISNSLKAFNEHVKIIKTCTIKSNIGIQRKGPICNYMNADKSFIDKPVKLSLLNQPAEDISNQSTNVTNCLKTKTVEDISVDTVIENVNHDVNGIAANCCKDVIKDKFIEGIDTLYSSGSQRIDKITNQSVEDVINCHSSNVNDFNQITNKIENWQNAAKEFAEEKGDNYKNSEKKSFKTVSNDCTLNADSSMTNHVLCDSLSNDISGDEKNVDLLDLSDNEISKNKLKMTIDKKASNASTTTGGYTSRSVVSTNYVRINIQKKAYMRKAGRGRFLRRKVFKEKMAKKGFLPRKNWRSSQTSRESSAFKSDSRCFKCGELGHWANQCKGRAKSTAKQQGLSTTQSDNECENIESIQELLNHHQLTSECPQEGVVGSECHSIHQCEPVYTDESYDKDEVLNTLKKFGFSLFRPGQEKAIKRILCGKPTLLVLSTGMGKSLCYQLPAYIYSAKRASITLVISPLVSLMDDQICGLPKFLKAVCLHSGMSKEQRNKIMTEIEEKKVDILLVSPEAITSWAGMSPYTSPFSKLPPISFVCIDECHCLSEWSHNFRPSYLRVCQVLKEHLGIKCVVGLTATSTISTCNSIARQLGIEDGAAGLIMETTLPENLRLSISRDKYKDEALQELLMNDPFHSLHSIIVYCTRRDEAARLASYLRTTLQCQAQTENVNVEGVVSVETPTNSKTKKRKRSTQVKRMTSAERRRVQKRFMTGQLRIVVATVAFGMGIDKQDVRAVIHYNMPRSFERYVQEIGRAGRDGETAYCHTFLTCENSDLSELSRHIYAKTVDRYVVKLLLKKVFQRCKCKERGRTCPGHFAAIPFDQTIEDLDLSKEGIETLLSYLELDSLIKAFLPTQAVCSIRCYDGVQQMAKVARKCPAVAIGLASKGSEGSLESDLQFSVIEAADRLGMGIVKLKRVLRSLMWDTTLSDNTTSGKSGVNVEFTEMSFLVQALREYSNDFLDQVSEALHTRVLRQERKELAQLQTCSDTLQRHSIPSVGFLKRKEIDEKSSSLKSVINKYFTQIDEDAFDHDRICQLQPAVETELRSSVRQFLCVHGADLGFRITGRAIARIFHGIESPRYPATSWGGARRFWRSHLSIDFNAVVRVATDELLTVR